MHNITSFQTTSGNTFCRLNVSFTGIPNRHGSSLVHDRNPDCSPGSPYNGDRRRSSSLLEPNLTIDGPKRIQPDEPRSQNSGLNKSAGQYYFGVPQNGSATPTEKERNVRTNAHPITGNHISTYEYGRRPSAESTDQPSGPRKGSVDSGTSRFDLTGKNVDRNQTERSPYNRSGSTTTGMTILDGAGKRGGDHASTEEVSSTVPLDTAAAFRKARADALKG